MPVPLPRPAFLVPTLLLLLGGCGAEDTNGSSPGADEVEPFRPGLHSLMIEMQFRHANIWFSGDAENWPLADYQLHEMEELVEDIVDFHPEYRGAPVGELMAMITPALEALDEAVERGDAEAFRSEFAGLTAGCNACHEATDREVIVIQRPQTPPMDNLRYSPGSN